MTYEEHLIKKINKVKRSRYVQREKVDKEVSDFCRGLFNEHKQSRIEDLEELLRLSTPY